MTKKWASHRLVPNATLCTKLLHHGRISPPSGNAIRSRLASLMSIEIAARRAGEPSGSIEQTSQRSNLWTSCCTSLLFDYAGSNLIRHGAHIQDHLGSLETCLKDWEQRTSLSRCCDEELRLKIQNDLDYLSTRVQNVTTFYKAGRSTIMSNASIEEAKVKRSNEQAVLVIDLTKATNRLTLIVLPISFLTSPFRMDSRRL